MNSEKTGPVVVLNLGAGVQSTCLYLMAVVGELRIDKAVFADVGEEPAEVYGHLEWLKSLGGPPISVISAGKLGDDLLQGTNTTGQRFASIPAFTTHTEGQPVGRVRRQCTSEYKIKPIEQWIRREILGLKPRERAPNDATVIQLFGISLDETARARSIQANDRFPWSVPVFPLIDREMTRKDCLDWMSKRGFPEPPRSACVFCPFKRNSEWLRLRENNADGWARAVEIDRGLRAPGVVFNRRFEQRLYLHSSCRPLESVHLTDDDRGQLGFWQECEGMCGN